MAHVKPESPIPSDEVRPLPRAIGSLGAIAIVVGTIIGSGIFLVPHNVALHVGSAGALFLAWVIGGLLSLAGALSFAELSSAIPEAGGVYSFLREAYGKLPAFLYGWANLLVINSGSIATLAVAFSIYAGSFIPLKPYEQKLIGSSVIALLTLVNIVGVRAGTAVQTIFTAAKLVGLAVIVGCAFGIRPGAPVVPAHPLPTPHTTLGSFGVALIGVLWACEGWHMLTFNAGEVKDPGRVLPRSFLLGTLLVVVVYLSANAAYLRVLPLAALAENQRVAHTTMEVLLGTPGARFVSALVLCSIFGALNGTILGGPRSYFAMARDRVFFRSVGKVHPRFETPALAILIQGIWSILLAASGTYEQLYTYVVTIGWFFYGMAALGVVVLRRRQPQLERPYRVWGYPLSPVAFALVSFLIIASAFVGSPREPLIGTGIVLLGVPVFFIWKRLAARPAAQ